MNPHKGHLCCAHAFCFTAQQLFICDQCGLRVHAVNVIAPYCSFDDDSVISVCLMLVSLQRFLQIKQGVFPRF